MLVVTIMLLRTRSAHISAVTQSKINLNKTRAIVNDRQIVLLDNRQMTLVVLLHINSIASVKYKYTKR